MLAEPSETTTTIETMTVEVTTADIICSKPWPCSEALRVAECESELKPWAVSPPNSNGTRDWGLMQVNDVWRPAFPVSWPNVLDAQTNIDMAWHIYQTAGNSWQPWACRP